VARQALIPRVLCLAELGDQLFFQTVAAVIGGNAYSHKPPFQVTSCPRSLFTVEASKMLWMASSSRALYSLSDCWAVNPSTSAREKLATMPWFLRRRLLPSSRE